MVTTSSDVPMKGLVPLLEAVAKLRVERDIELTVIGRPQPKGRVAAAITRLGLEDIVTTITGVSDEELARLYGEAQVAVVPSLYEGFSLPAIEAMACAVPVVATTGGALPEVVGVSGETGLLVEPNDPDALVAAISRLLDDEALRRRLGANGRQITRTMLVPRSEVTIIDNWQVLGLRGTGSDSYELKDHFVPQSHTAMRDNDSERREPGPLYQFTSGMIYAMSFSHVSLGIARGAYDAFIEIARDKVPRGAKGTLRENNVVQAQVSQCEAKLKSSRAYLRGVIAEMWDDAQRTGKISAEHHPQLRLASTWAINQARDVVATVYHAAGASAIFESNPLERRMRDIHAGTQQGQGRPIHFETVGQMLMGMPPEGRMFR